MDEVIQEYFELGHAELVPIADLNKPKSQVFYLPIHAVQKESSTAMKVRSVFDASAKSTTNVSLNDTLLVGPTVHPPLIDVLLRFRYHRIALITDVSKMYRAIQLANSDKDLHRFVWRQSPKDLLKDYQMIRATFDVPSSAFIANMAVKQNALDYAEEFPMASKAAQESFYVDDCYQEQILLRKPPSCNGNCTIFSAKKDFYCTNGILTLLLYLDTYLTSTRIHYPCI